MSTIISGNTMPNPPLPAKKVSPVYYQESQVSYFEQNASPQKMDTAAVETRIIHDNQQISPLISTRLSSSQGYPPDRLQNIVNIISQNAFSAFANPAASLGAFSPNRSSTPSGMDLNILA